MPSFRDSSGKTWEVRVDVAAVKRVLDLAQVDLRVIESGKTLAELALDPIKLVDTLYAVVKPQVDAAGLSDEQFAALFAGDVLEQAATALIDGILDFFPASQRPALAKLRAAIDRGTRKVFSLAEAELNPDKIESEIESRFRRLSKSSSSNG
jgi:hypothetical protein